MKSDYTQNGRHKDDPTNPQSHWNDWSIDRDGNSLKEDRFKDEDKQIEEIRRKIEKEIDKVNEELIKCYKKIAEGSDSYIEKVKVLEGKKEGLRIALSKVK